MPEYAYEAIAALTLIVLVVGIVAFRRHRKQRPATNDPVVKATRRVSSKMRDSMRREK